MRVTAGMHVTIGKGMEVMFGKTWFANLYKR